MTVVPMSLEEVIAFQRERGLGNVHVVYIGHTGFHLAHTDYERALGLNNPGCRVHEWLSGLPEAPTELGLYTVIAHEPDGYSDSYRSIPWELVPVE